MSVPDHFFDVFEAAKIAGVTHETIRLKIKAGDLTEYRVKNRALRVDPDELAAVEWIRRPFWSWVAENETGCWVWQGRLLKGPSVPQSAVRQPVALRTSDPPGERPSSLRLPDSLQAKATSSRRRTRIGLRQGVGNATSATPQHSAAIRPGSEPARSGFR